MNNTANNHFKQYKIILAAVGLAFAASLPGYALADSHRDHDRARQAFANGEVLSLQEVLEIVNKQYAGKPLKVEFDHDDGMYEYEIKILRDDGSVVKVKADATNGKIIKVKERRK